MVIFMFFPLPVAAEKNDKIEQISAKRGSSSSYISSSSVPESDSHDILTTLSFYDTKSGNVVKKKKRGLNCTS